MSDTHLEYPLDHGYVHNWLVAGPLSIPVPDLARFAGTERKLEIARHHRKKASDIFSPPMEGESFEVSGQELAWSYYRCLDDHFVDRSAFYHTCHYLRSWAYAQVLSPSAQEVTLILTTNGPADVWLNRQHVSRQEHLEDREPKSVPFRVMLQEGANEVLVRFEQVAARECPYAMALQIVGLSTGEESRPVRLPTASGNPARRMTYEHMFEQVHVERETYLNGGGIVLYWADDLDTETGYCVRLQDWRDRIYLEGNPDARPSAVVDLGSDLRVEAGDYSLVLMPPPTMYYQGDVRYRRRLPLRVVDVPYSDAPYGTYDQRRREALEHAGRQEGSLYSEIAKFGSGRWASASTDAIAEAVNGINERRDCSDLDVVGLLGLTFRHGDIPTVSRRLEPLLRECVLGFKYWHDEPGSDVMCYTTENHRILFHTCEILAGQLYPDLTFTNAGETGRWHRAKGERLALEWLHERGAEGFSEWDSNCTFEEDLVALSHLASLAENEEIRELAAIVTDKMFFTIALNSYKGVFGATHGRTCAAMVKGGRSEGTAGITRLMWGMGTYNTHIAGTVSLACSNYELPSIIADIATNLLDEMWDREHHPGVDKVTYRTPDYMLSSAQDHSPGERGCEQHIWQATMGHDAVVFVTHPSCASEEGSHRPSFWRGNRVLPRVAQWKDTLIAIHKLPEDDWMGFTHAYWPVYEFDEYALRDGWAFARKGQGYLALTASQGLELTTQGKNAYRELRSYGQDNVWLCLMGRRALDGGFADFQERTLALDVDVGELDVRCTTLRGETLSFGWTGPLLVDDQEQAITGFKHYENPYCVAELGASPMEVRYGEYLLRLHFDLEREESSPEA